MLTIRFGEFGEFQFQSVCKERRHAVIGKRRENLLSIPLEKGQTGIMRALSIAPAPWNVNVVRGAHVSTTHQKPATPRKPSMTRAEHKSWIEPAQRSRKARKRAITHPLRKQMEPRSTFETSAPF
jgi:hypothetical protein